MSAELIARLQSRFAGTSQNVTGTPVVTAETASYQRRTPGTCGTADIHNAESMSEWQQERAAIMEYDGGLNRDEAERQALLRTHIRLGLPPDYRLH